MRIDAHQHFWSYSAKHYGWIADNDLTALERDFLPGDLRPLLDAHGIDGTVAVQAQQSEAETRWLLAATRSEPQLARVLPSSHGAHGRSPSW